MSNTKRIEQARELLGMIESANHMDSKVLNELDARAACLFQNKEYDRHTSGWVGKPVAFFKVKDPVSDFDCLGTVLSYSRSRDALKAARPEGYKTFQITYTVSDQYICFAGRRFDMVPLATEELAEFHAIVQAWIYVWENEA